MTSKRFEPFAGRILWLAKDRDKIVSQLQGQSLPRPELSELVSRLSTDEILPAWACFRYDESLGEEAMTGYREAVFPRGALKNGGFSVLVTGPFQGTGSSREVAPWALRAAHIRLCLAPSFEKIYRQNCHNIGIFTSSDFTLLDLLESGQPIAFDRLVAGLEPGSVDVLAHGGLIPLMQERVGCPRRTLPSSAGAVGRSPTRAAPHRPMTMVEQIVSAHLVEGQSPTGAVQPFDEVFARADLRMSHDYVTAMVERLYLDGFGSDAPLFEPESIVLFRDHLPLVKQVLKDTDEQRRLVLWADDLADKQSQFAKRHGLRLFGEGGLPEGICHQVILEHLASPSQLIVGTDSHTMTAGAIGALAFGIGSTDMACAWRAGEVRLRVPESLRLELRGSLSPYVTAKDVMLSLLSREEFRSGWPLGRVLEFGGEGVVELSLDERATLTNMAVEAGAFGAIVEVDRALLLEVAERRAVDAASLLDGRLVADAGAVYAGKLSVELDQVKMMVATPGDPHNAVALSELLLGPPIPIDIAYVGSCTGGKCADIDAAAAVVRAALGRGLRVMPGVEFYVQCASATVFEHARNRGYLEQFELAGARLLPPACGACIRAGPGVSVDARQTTISTINRNFPGRSGPGRVYLAGPYVVAASAFAGRIASPEQVIDGAP